MSQPSIATRCVFLGAPGAGKGTQAKQVAGAAGVAHVSTGDMLRSQVAAKTALGLEAKSYIDAGQLVPDGLIIGMVRQRIGEPDARFAWILDGFPRTLVQATALDESLPADLALTRVVYFSVPEAVLLARLTGRRTCGTCGAIWHVESKPTSKAGSCDFCGGALVHRSDDYPDKITKRLEEYRTLTAPLLDYYRNRKLLREIDANRPPQLVNQELLQQMR
jgi:adenylate kinase